MAVAEARCTLRVAEGTGRAADGSDCPGQVAVLADRAREAGGLRRLALVVPSPAVDRRRSGCCGALGPGRADCACLRDGVAVVAQTTLRAGRGARVRAVAARAVGAGQRTRSDTTSSLIRWSGKPSWINFDLHY